MSQDDAAVSKEFFGLSINPENELEPPHPPPPNLTSKGVVALDITAKFVASAKALDVGELIKDGYFTLFDSVGAPEIMDPKMDSGYLASGESLDDDYDVTRPLLPAEVIGIIDQLLCLEMAWHLGYPLSQTLFTNVYVEHIMIPNPMTIEDADFLKINIYKNPKSPEHIVLRAYCLGLIKACAYVLDTIRYEHFYEEEDFVTNTLNRPLLNLIDVFSIRDLIQDARATVHSLRHSWSSEVVLALDARLELRYAFLRAIELTSIRSHPEAIKTPWIQMQAILENINATHGLAVPVPECFSTKLQRRLASTMPPRPIVHLSFEDAYSRWKRLYEDGVEINDVLKYTDSQTLLNFVMTFQAKRPQPLIYIRTLLQSYIFQDNIVLGSMSLRQIMDDDFSTVVLPCSILLDPANDAIEAVQDPRFAIAHQMEVFRQRAAPQYLDIFRAFCQNRCRIRRTLCFSIQEWDNVQLDAEEIDQLLHIQLDGSPNYAGAGSGGSSSSSSGGGPPPSSLPHYPLPLSYWVYLYKVRQMEWIVQLGFELEIYQADELAGMYWYLSYLAKMRAQHVERIKAATVEHLNEQRARPQTFTAAKEATFTRSLSYLRTTMLDAAVTWELADALSSLYVALQRLGAIKPPPRPYGTDELRFELRMKPFIPVGNPELPSFAAFAEAVEQPDCDTAALLDDAEQAVAGAKKGFEALAKLGEKEAFTTNTHDRWLAGTKNCLKSAIFTGIAISTVRRAMKKAEAAAAGDKKEGSGELEVKLKVEVPKPEKGYHEWWIIPKITEGLE